jgi:hypothetical protein
MIQGTPKANGMAVSMVSASSKGVWELEVTVRFVDTESGTTHSSCKVAGPWSEDTVKKLKELVDSVERDASKHLLKDPDLVKDGKDGLGLGLVESSLGLGEYIGQESI